MGQQSTGGSSRKGTNVATAAHGDSRTTSCVGACRAVYVYASNERPKFVAGAVEPIRDVLRAYCVMFNPERGIPCAWDRQRWSAVIVARTGFNTYRPHSIESLVEYEPAARVTFRFSMRTRHTAPPSDGRRTISTPVSLQSVKLTDGRQADLCCNMLETRQHCACNIVD